MARSRFGQRLRTLAPAIRREVEQAMVPAGDVIRVAAQISITEDSTSAAGQHRPSLPGQPPNNDTGTLANGIETRHVAPLKVEVVSTAPYSGYLEFGTSRVAARPFMLPAAKRKEAEVVKMLGEAARRGARRHMKD